MIEPPDAELDVHTLLRTLREHDVEFVIIGGLAVVAHGFLRGTKDLDIAPKPTPENRRRLHDALVSLDGRPLDLDEFRPEELPVPFTPAGLAEGGNWRIRTTAGIVDVFQWVAGIESYDALRRSAVEGDLPDVGAVLVAGYDDLVAMKRAAGRPRDELDLQQLRAARGEE